MKRDVQIFSCKLIREASLEPKMLKRMLKIAGDDCELLALGELVLDHELADFETVQRLLDDTCDEVAEGGQPPFDPLEEPEVRQPSSLADSSAQLASASGAHGDESCHEAVSLEGAASERGGSSKVEDPPSGSSALPEEQQSEMEESNSPAAPSALESAERESLPSRASKSPADCVVERNGVEAFYPKLDSAEQLSAEQIRESLIGLLLACERDGVSDLHLSAGARPFIRKYGVNNYLCDTPLSREFAERLVTSLLTSEQIEYFKLENDIDLVVAFDSGHRFRVNMMMHKDGIAGTYRIVPRTVSSLESLGFSVERSETIKKMLSYHNGLVLVTGPVGSGKTTTLAALVDEMNRNRSDHIICVEEPIEIVYSSAQCSVTQRGVGSHTSTFHSALKGALRQDPDIIVIGEMRDLETIEMAISASETGHLVIGTMHTSDASNTLNRLLDVFPPAQQSQIRAMVAESLKGIICQRLLPSTNGEVVLASEILLNNLAVGALIREGKSQGLSNILETGTRQGMVSMDASVLELYRKGLLTEETARKNIRNEMVRRQIEGAGNIAVVGSVAGHEHVESTLKKKKFFG